MNEGTKHRRVELELEIQSKKESWATNSASLYVSIVYKSPWHLRLLFSWGRRDVYEGISRYFVLSLKIFLWGEYLSELEPYTLHTFMRVGQDLISGQWRNDVLLMDPLTQRNVGYSVNCNVLSPIPRSPAWNEVRNVQSWQQNIQSSFSSVRISWTHYYHQERFADFCELCWLLDLDSVTLSCKILVWKSHCIWTIWTRIQLLVMEIKINNKGQYDWFRIYLHLSRRQRVKTRSC